MDIIKSKALLVEGDLARLDALREQIKRDKIKESYAKKECFKNISDLLSEIKKAKGKGIYVDDRIIIDGEVVSSNKDIKKLIYRKK